jgi:hypothetical protein
MPVAEIHEDLGLVSESEKSMAFFAYLTKMSHDILAHVKKDVTDVDAIAPNSATVAQSVFKIQPQYIVPIVVEFILATFPSTSTSVTIQLGTRIIPVTNLNAGFWNPQLRMQLEPADLVQMTVVPAGVGHFEIMGRTVERVIDRP